MKSFCILAVCLIATAGCDGQIAGSSIRHPIPPSVPQMSSASVVVPFVAADPMSQPSAVIEASPPQPVECLPEPASALVSASVSVASTVEVGSEPVPVSTADIAGSHLIEQINRIMHSYRTEE